MSQAESPDATRPLSRIFINYRRSDSEDITGRIQDWLRKSFGERLFLDVDDIPAGVDFQAHIERQLQSCDIVLAIIGRHWLQVIHPRTGQRRLDDPADHVRMELVAALNRPAIRVIPVLVHDTQMPTPDQLPPDLQALARRNAVEVRTRNFNTDISRLIARMTEALTQADEARVRGDSAQAALAAAAIDETERAEFIRAEYDEQLRRQAWHRIDEDVLRYRRRYSWRTMYGMLSHSVWLNPARGDIRDLGSVERRCRNLIVRVRSIAAVADTFNRWAFERTHRAVVLLPLIGWVSLFGAVIFGVAMVVGVLLGTTDVPGALTVVTILVATGFASLAVFGWLNRRHGYFRLEIANAPAVTELTDGPALFRLGELYRWADEPACAFQLYLKAAHLGHADAANAVAAAYEGGIGVSKNQNEAEKWRRRG